MKVVSAITGKASKRIGNAVFATIAGTTIAREYNPNVSNPNTDSQRDTRSRFKLLSQLSAAMAPAIAIRREGLKTPRNLFTSVNFPYTIYEDDVASIDLNAVQLTKSTKSLSSFSADRSGADVVVKLDDNSADILDNVVYIEFVKNSNNVLEYVDSTVVHTAGDLGQFVGHLKKVAGTVVFYAYGIKFLNSSILTKFADMQAPSAESVAMLLTSSSSTMSSVALTQTNGLTLEANDTTGDSDSQKFRVTSITLDGKNITYSIPPGTTFTAGNKEITVVVAGNIPTGAKISMLSTNGSAWFSWDITSETQTDSYGLVAGQEYYIGVYSGNSLIARSAKIVVVSE